MNRICSKCKIEKPITDFCAVSKKGKKYYSHCKVCHSLYTKKNTENTGEKYIFQLLKRSGHVEISDDLIEIKRQLIILKRNIKWQTSKV